MPINTLVQQELIQEASQEKQVTMIVKLLRLPNGQRFLVVSQMIIMLVTLNQVIAILRQVKPMKFLDKVLYVIEESTANKVLLLTALKVTSVEFKG
jgi:hypothetical protein